MNELRADFVIDLTGLRHPMAVTMAKEFLNKINPGHVLRVDTSDPATIGNMQAIADSTGSKLISTGRDGSVSVFYIKKITTNGRK